MSLHQLRHHPWVSGATPSPLATPRAEARIHVSDDDIAHAVTKLVQLKTLSTVTLMVTRQLLKNRRKRHRRAARRKQRNMELKQKLAAHVRATGRLTGVVRAMSQRSMLQAAKHSASAPTPPPGSRATNGTGAGAGAGAGAEAAPPSLPAVRETSVARSSQQAGNVVVNGYRLGAVLGRGAFGVVHEATCNLPGVPCWAGVRSELCMRR